MNDVVTSQPLTASFATLPALRAPFFGGAFIGITTLADGRHVAVTHLANADKKRDHAGATAYAEKLGGVLATPAIFQMLIDTAPDLVPAGWSWTSKVYSAVYAWFCYSSGLQYYDDRSSSGGAVVVRLILLTL